jgi:hypothetical protein
LAADCVMGKLAAEQQSDEAPKGESSHAVGSLATLSQVTSLYSPKTVPL